MLQIFCNHEHEIIKRFKTTKSGQELRLRLSQQFYECMRCGRTRPIPMYQISGNLAKKTLDKTA